MTRARVLDGCNALDEHQAEIEWQSMIIDPNPTDHGPFIATPINGVARVMSP